MSAHVLEIVATPALDDGDFDVEIKCPGVTDVCAEWMECKVDECPGRDGDDDALSDTSGVAHGEEHQYIDGWMVRSGNCWLINHGHSAAAEIAEDKKLRPGRYQVTPEFEDGQLADLHLVTTAPKLSAGGGPDA